MRTRGWRYLGFILGLACLCLLMGRQAAHAQMPTCDVTWRKIDGTRVISAPLTIPAGQTVCIEPGVRVEFTGNGRINLDGRLVGTGASDDRIQLVAQSVFPNKIEVRGALELRFADINANARIYPGGSLIYRDSTIGLFGGLLSNDPSSVNSNPMFVLIENTLLDSAEEESFSDNASIYLSFVHLIMRNVTVRNSAWANISRSYIYIDNYTSQNARFDGLELIRLSEQPPLFLNNINVTGAGEAGLRLIAGNYLIGSNVTLAGNKYPVRGGGGLLPGSNVPAAGNQNNWIELDGGMQPWSIYAPQSVPYVATGGLFSATEILPGAVFKARPNFRLDNFGNTHGRILGLPGAPITFEPFSPAEKWHSVEFHRTGDRMEYTIIDGSRFGFADTDVSGTSRWVDNSVWRNNDIAINDPHFDLYYIQGNLFTNNGIAVNLNGPLNSNFSGETNPNLFENNTLAVRAINGANPLIPFNWWNSPTGPTTPQNPGGTGDRIEGPAQFQPFRTARPDRTDHPPVVRLTRRPFQLTAGDFDGVVERGQRVILTWNAFDNAAIVKHKILFSQNDNRRENFVVVADNLPGTQRSYEFTMPDVGALGGTHKFIRIVAVDALGQEGYDEWQVLVPTGTEPGELLITNPVGGQTFRGGQRVQVNWSVTLPFNASQFSVYLLLDADRKAVLVANGGNTGSFSPVEMPFVSTDSARIAVQSQGGGNQVKWFYTEPFAIRPDARWIDQPPQISMTSPQAGQAFPMGGIVPISWTASDDEALRSYSILYSTDGGRNWLTLVENLPPNTTSYNWQTPPGTGFNDVRVRVVAFDLRFQNSSDGANRSFRLTGGPPLNARRAAFDFDGDGRTDVSVYRGGAWYLQQSASGFAALQFGLATDRITPADFDGDRKTDPAVFRAGAWYIMSSQTGSMISAQFGQAGDVPQPFDYDGDGRADMAVFRAGTWYILESSNNQMRAEAFGQSGDVPVAADYDGDGRADLAVYRSGVWYLMQSRDGFRAQQFGLGGDVPLAADYDGDGRADLAVFRAGSWYIQHSSDNSFHAQQFGLSTDRPAPGDFDGDGRADMAVFRNGAWYAMRSTDGFMATQFGMSGDLAVPAAFTP